MYPQQVHNYLETFFTETNCPILSSNGNYLTVQLTVDMDKKIMNRPFYWKYLEATEGEPNPAQITFITDYNNLVDNIKGEIIHFGTPRLNQLFRVTKELGTFVRMYEKVENKTERTNLIPWLGVNYKVSYYSDQTKEMLYSLGINLMTGAIYDDFQERLNESDLFSTKSEDAFLLQYIIKPTRGLERLEAAIENFIQQDDHSWADEAKNRWQKDQRVLDYFYEGVEIKPENYEMEKEALAERYDARIKVEIINGGLFYLK